MTRDELSQDLAYVRTLAEEGRHAPLIGGSYLVLFGALLTICYSAHFALLNNWFGPQSYKYAGAIWIGFGLGAVIGWLVVRQRVRALPGAASLPNQVDRAVWTGVGTALFMVVFGCIGRAVMTGDWLAMDAIMAAGFGLYGVALKASASISNYAWLRRFAWISFAASLVLWMFQGHAWIYLSAAISSVLVLLIPGLIMMRREPSPVV